MLKKAAERIFYQHQFRRTDGRGWLNADETIATATATVTDIATGADVTAAMISNVAPYGDTSVRYQLAAGTAGHTYRITITITTSNGQTMVDTAEVRIS